MFRKICFPLLALLMLFQAMTCFASSVDPLSADRLTLYAINVRKGDCLILKSGNSTYMIDSGRAENWGAISAALRSYGITHLNGVILTHTDGDHCGGLMALASSSIAVDAWYTSKYYADVKTSKHPARLAAGIRGQFVQWLKAGDTLPLDGGTLTVLGPIHESETENNNSLVLRAETTDGSILLTGDMEFEEENDLLKAGVLSACTVLKVANHAEKDATSQTLINVVRPKVAVISTNSEDEPDTPSSRVLKALKNAGVQIATTQSSTAGTLVTLDSGTAQVSLLDWPEWPEMCGDIRLTAKDNIDFTTTVTNTGSQTVDLSGWFIHSERGNEIFVFPEGSSLAAGASCVISCLSSEQTGDYVWQDTKVWHASKPDAGALYDAYGRLIDRLE